MFIHPFFIKLLNINWTRLLLSKSEYTHLKEFQDKHYKNFINNPEYYGIKPFKYKDPYKRKQ